MEDGEGISLFGGMKIFRCGEWEDWYVLRVIFCYKRLGFVEFVFGVFLSVIKVEIV